MIGVFDRLQRGFAFLEAARLRDGVAVQVWLEVADDLDGNAGDVRGDLVGRPPLARTDRVRRGSIDGFQERLGFGAALNHEIPPVVCRLHKS